MWTGLWWPYALPSRVRHLACFLWKNDIQCTDAEKSKSYRLKTRTGLWWPCVAPCPGLISCLCCVGSESHYMNVVPRKKLTPESLEGAVIRLCRCFTWGVVWPGPCRAAPRTTSFWRTYTWWMRAGSFLQLFCTWCILASTFRKYPAQPLFDEHTPAECAWGRSCSCTVLLHGVVRFCEQLPQVEIYLPSLRDTYHFCGRKYESPYISEMKTKSSLWFRTEWAVYSAHGAIEHLHYTSSTWPTSHARSKYHTQLSKRANMSFDDIVRSRSWMCLCVCVFFLSLLRANAFINSCL